MAELTYDDVRRAAQDAVRDLQGIINGLKANSEDIRRGVQQSSGAQGQLNDLASRLNTLQYQLNDLSNAFRNHSNTAYTVQSMQQSLADLHRRLGVTEEFIKYMYGYFAAQQEAEQLRQARRRA